MGLSVRFHDDHLEGDSADDVGIALAANNGWLYLTADHGSVALGGPLLRTVAECEAKCFALMSVNHLSADRKVGVVQMHLGFMERMDRKRTGPFAYRLYENGNRKNVRLL